LLDLPSDRRSEPRRSPTALSGVDNADYLPPFAFTGKID
jgi:hypothetical protein